MNRSESITNLATGLSKAQAAIEGAVKDAVNPGYKSRYATLLSNLEACRGPLTANGLSVVQLPSTSANAVSLTTWLLHDSGEWLESDPLTVLARDAGPQAVGSCISYLRRYQLAALVGIAPEDDDAEAAEKPRAVNEPTGYSVAAPNGSDNSARSVETRSAPKRGDSGVSPAYGVTQHGEELPDDGKLYVARVDLSKTKNPKVQRGLVTFSDGRQASTIKDKLIALAEQLCQDREAVELWADDIEETKWGLNLLNLRRAASEPPFDPELFQGPPSDEEPF